MARRTEKDTGSEFWRDIPAIEGNARPGAQNEVYIPNAPIDDERYYVPLSETVFTRPLWMSIEENRWCDILYAKEPGLVNRHYHPRGVFAYTISGRWGYLEYDWIAEPGDFIFETPGQGHTLVSYESDEPMRVHFNVQGPLIWLDEKGDTVGYFDVFDYIENAKAHYEKVGLGAHLIDELIR